MNPLVVLTCVFAAACAAPAPGDYAAPVAAVAAAPVVAPAAAVAYAAPVAHVPKPAPYSTEHVAGAPVTHISQAPAVVSKQLHFGKTQFISGYASAVHKPAIPDFKIAVPTVLKGSVAYNTPLVKTVKETHVVNEPFAVERRVEVPYDVPVPREVIEEVAVPVHVDKPYAVPHPVAVPGEPIVNVRRGQPIVQRTHSAVAAAPAVVAAGYAAAPAIAHHAAGYAAAPAIAHHAAGYAAAPAIAHHAAAIPAVATPALATGYAAAPAAVLAKEY